MSELEGVGEAVTGGLLASAVEPRAGATGRTGTGNCLNCAAPLTGAYCAHCGQKAHINRSLKDFFQDLAQAIFNFEGKIWRTLPMLAWRPGDMTRRYIEGERARFVSPVALYLFSVFLMFATLNFNGNIVGPGSTVSAGLAVAEADEQAQIARLDAERSEQVAKQLDTAAVDRALAAARQDLADVRRVRSGQVVQFDGNEKAPAWAERLVKRAQSNPELFVANIQDTASKYSWALIPLSVPFLWLLFPFRRRYHLYDHTVFITYSLSFMMILVVMASLIVAAGQPAIASMLFFVPPWHIYRQLRGAYQLSRFGALWRTFLLLIFTFVVLALFGTMLVGLGLLG
jgi:hypothetical protein